MKANELIVRKIIDAANKTAPDSEMFLFGSRARGDAGRLSDYDLLILLNSSKLSFELEIKLMDEFYEIEIETGEIISPLIYTKNDWNEHHSITPLYDNINKDGIRIK